MAMPNGKNGKNSAVADEINKWLRTVKKAQCFRDKIKVYAPTCYGQCTGTVNKLIKDINEIFKGSTVYDATGTWWNPDQRNYEKEPVKVIEIAGKCTNREKSQAFARAIMEYSTKANQHSLSVDDRDFFIARSPQLVKAYVKEMKRTGQ